jgi:hypothetical protein
VGGGIQDQLTNSFVWRINAGFNSHMWGTVTGTIDAVTHLKRTMTSILWADLHPRAALIGIYHGYADPIHEDWVSGNRAGATGRLAAIVAEVALTVVVPEASGGRAAEAADAVATTTARLQGHVNEAVAGYESGAISMSARQARAAARNPNLEATFRGQVIDNAVKNGVRNDPELSHLWVSRSGEYGPDFHDIRSGTWWDVTTPGQWASHVHQYSEPFGWGIGLFTR